MFINIGKIIYLALCNDFGLLFSNMSYVNIKNINTIVQHCSINNYTDSNITKIHFTQELTHKKVRKFISVKQGRTKKQKKWVE